MGPRAPRAARPRPPLALDSHENQELLDTLNSERFVDTAPAALHATLLDEGRYLGSVRTMYRLLAIHGGCRERRHQLTHPAYAKPELLALAPNQVWSWDITKLKGPAKWTCFHLYVILCRRRLNFDPPRRLNFYPGMDAGSMLAGCGQVE